VGAIPSSTGTRGIVHEEMLSTAGEDEKLLNERENGCDHAGHAISRSEDSVKR
jgi:hypothetical protein